jgi:AcrR family transcriptional regulator
VADGAPSPNGSLLSPGRQKALARRRQRLLDAAAGLLFSGGYDKLAVREVADLAGLSTRTLYNHFASKEHLVLAVVTDLARRSWLTLADDLPEDISPIERARHLLAGASAGLTGAPDVAGAIVRAMGSRQPELVPLLVEFDTTMREALTRALAPDQPTQHDIERAVLLQQVWFTAMVSWISGVQDPDYMTRSIDTALALIAETPDTNRPTARNTDHAQPGRPA